MYKDGNRKIGGIVSISCEALFMQFFHMFILLETLVTSHEGLQFVAIKECFASEVPYTIIFDK